MSIAPTDAELVARCRIGDDAAWELLVERFSRYVHAILTRAFTLPPHTAEDAFQEVFARAYEHLNRLRDDAAIRPWLAQLTRRIAIDALRADARERAADVAEIERIDTSAQDRLDRIEQAIAVRAALAELPEHCSEVLDRFFARDESYATIGAALDIPQGTIASRISRCLSKLREKFEHEGRSPAPTASGGR
jgi:RNA polymerase sigma-70 factor (ECF subfamily)